MTTDAAFFTRSEVRGSVENAPHRVCAGVEPPYPETQADGIVDVIPFDQSARTTTAGDPRRPRATLPLATSWGWAPSASGSVPTPTPAPDTPTPPPFDA